MATVRGIPLSKVSPAFLHANSTSHTWIFSAFAELIDNAYDPDVSASELLIDKIDIHGVPCLIFLDNGAGMDTQQLLKMLSFGFCEKAIYEKQGSHQPIGHYGNGFKSGSMRIGKDALVFTRCHKSASIGFLSQTYLTAVQTDSVVVPILEYRLPSLERIKSQESRNNLNAILQFSVFKMEDELKEELKALEGSKTGTKIIIYNLKRLQDRNYELDFSSDPRDIRCPEAHEVDMTSVYHRPIQHSSSEYKRSLREYCSILFLRPRMKITIRGCRVKSKLISKSLSNTEIDMYKPTWLSRPVKIIFGFNCEKGKSEDYDYGMMLYHRNRLIKAFEKVGYQKQPNGLGVGVVGVAQVDFLQPIHNKQDFNKDEKFNSVMSAFSNKLNDYWNEKKGSNSLSSSQPVRNLPDWLWAQCDHCLKWRRLPDEVDSESLPDLWYCRMNSDATHNRCDIPEEPEDEDLAVKPTYEKTFKKKQEERKRMQQIEREKEEEVKIRKIMAKEQELKQKEATLRAIQQVTSAQPHLQDNRTVASLQKALAEVRRKEEQQKRLILQIQEQKKLMEEQRNSLLQMAENLQKADKDKSKDVLKQMSKLIGTFTSSTTSSPASSNKRKFSEEAPATPSAKSKKKICIKTETGEMLSITQNDLDSDDNEDIDTNHNNSASSRKRRENLLTVKFDTKKNTSTVTPSKTLQVNQTIENDCTKNDKKSGITAQTSSPTKPRRKQQKGAVMAVIDLTSESEFGELVDIKPDLDGLREAIQENLQEGLVDLKPDKDALDEVISQSDGKQKAAVPPLNEAKQEIIEPSQQSSTALLPKKASENEEIKDVKEAGNVNFGPSVGDPECPLIPENFQDNLEAAMSAIQERIEREKLEHEDRSNHSFTEASINISDSNNALKTEKVAAASSPQQHNDSDSSLGAASEDSDNVRISEVGAENSDTLRINEVEGETSGKLRINEVETEDSNTLRINEVEAETSEMLRINEVEAETSDKLRINEVQTEKEDGEDLESEFTTANFSFKDVMITSGDDDNSDCDGLVEDDSDYRDYSTLYEKGYSSEPHINRKQCDRMGESRNNSIEDGGGSSDQGISVDGESYVQHENVESPDDNPTDVDRPGETNDSFNEEQNSTDCSRSKVVCELQNSVNGDLSESLTNVDSACLDNVTKINDSLNSHGQNQLSVAQSGIGAEGPQNNIMKSVLNICNGHSEPIIKDVQESVCEKHSPGISISKSSLSYSGIIHENPINEDNNMYESEDSVYSENKCENENSVDNGKNMCVDGESADNEMDCENEASLDDEHNFANENSVDSENNLLENDDSMEHEQNMYESVVSNQEHMSMKLERTNSCERLSNESGRKSRCSSSLSFEESLSAHKNVQSSSKISVAVMLDSISVKIVQDNMAGDKIHDNNGTAESKCEDHLQSTLSECKSDKKCNKHCELTQTRHQCLQTDVDMTAISELLRQHADSDVGEMSSANGFLFKNKLVSDIVRVDKSLQTSDCEQTFTTAESQTEVIEWKNSGTVEEETMERLQKELSLKSQCFEEVEKKLFEINANIYKLLGFLSPETELGDVSNVGQIIKGMIKVHVDSCQLPESKSSLS